MVAKAANVKKEKSDSLKLKDKNWKDEGKAESKETKRGKSVMGISMREKLKEGMADKSKVPKDKDKSKDTGEVFRTALFGGPPV